MTNKQLIKLLKEEAKKTQVPEITEKVLQQVEINKLKTTVEKESYEEKKSKRMFSRINLVPIFSSLIVVMLILVVINLIPNGTNGVSNVSRRHKVYAIQAITLVNFAENYNETMELSSNKSNSSLMKLGKERYSIQEYDKIAYMINQYMLTASELINFDALNYEVLESTEINYQYMMSINIDILGGNTAYTLFFNEEPLNIQNSDYDLDEISTRLSGIIRYNDHEYKVEGTKEIEDDEQEIELKMYLSADLSKYLIVSQEIENHENEYSYVYFDNGKLVQEFEMSIEEKKNKKIVELEIIENNSIYDLEFSYENEYIYVEYEINDYEGEVKITSTDQEYNYNFTDEIKIIIKK